MGGEERVFFLRAQFLPRSRKKAHANQISPPQCPQGRAKFRILIFFWFFLLRPCKQRNNKKNPRKKEKLRSGFFLSPLRDLFHCLFSFHCQLLHTAACPLCLSHLLRIAVAGNDSEKAQKEKERRRERKLIEKKTRLPLFLYFLSLSLTFSLKSTLPLFPPRTLIIPLILSLSLSHFHHLPTFNPIRTSTPRPRAPSRRSRSTGR